MKSENSLNQYCRMINKNNLVKLSKEQLADILLGLIMKSRSLIKKSACSVGRSNSYRGRLSETDFGKEYCAEVLSALENQFL